MKRERISCRFELYQNVPRHTLKARTAFIYVMRDAVGNLKIGTAECAISRRYIVQTQVEPQRRPIELVRVVEVRRWDAYAIEAAAHRELERYRLDDLGKSKEWFSASLRVCNAAIDRNLVD
jgi:hypothetical protein